MPLDRAPWTALIDDDGSNLVGTIWNKDKIKTTILDPVDAALAGGSGLTANHVNVSLTGTQHNLACGPASMFTSLFFNNTADLTVTGLAFTTPARAGDLVIMHARNVGHVFLYHNHGSSTAKFSNLATSAVTPLAANTGRAIYIFSSGVWVLVHHEQGAWLTPAFSATDYFGYSGMTWAVTAGQVGLCRYALRGRSLAWALRVTGTTIGGTVGATLGRVIPGGFTAAGVGYTSLVGVTGAVGVGTAVVDTSSTFLQFNRSLAFPAWTAGALDLAGSGASEVT